MMKLSQLVMMYQSGHLGGLERVHDLEITCFIATCFWRWLIERKPIETPNDNTYPSWQLNSRSSGDVQLMEINRLVRTTTSLCSNVCSMKTITAMLWVWKVVEWETALWTFDLKELASPLMGTPSVWRMSPFLYDNHPRIFTLSKQNSSETT
jgi:hypothetical protein